MRLIQLRDDLFESVDLLVLDDLDDFVDILGLRMLESESLLVDVLRDCMESAEEKVEYDRLSWLVLIRPFSKSSPGMLCFEDFLDQRGFDLVDDLLEWSDLVERCGW